MDILKEMTSIKDRIPYFLENQCRDNTKGFFAYSYSGDLYDDHVRWGLGSATYALKLAYTIGLEKDNPLVENAILFIKSFEHKNGYFYDDLIYKKSFISNLKSAIVHRQFDNLLNERYKSAESRQSCSSLMLFDEFPDNLPQNFIFTEEWVGKYLNGFNWEYPWASGSHASHLLFYLNLFYTMGRLSENEYISLKNYIINWIEKLHNPDTGSWYIKSPSVQEQINGAMKIITGYNVVNFIDIKYSEKLIDLCLSNINNEQACDNFNIIYVLYYASMNCKGYREKEIIEFAEKRFAIYLNHYHEKQGGFSFFPDHANQKYYGAIITKGKNEADIHGTTLFMWGITLISKILNINEQVKLYEFKA